MRVDSTRVGAALQNGASCATEYHTLSVGGLNLFYRDAGPAAASAVSLLHGFPASSRKYSRLTPLLTDRLDVVVPEYPGFARSDVPPPTEFAYTYDHLAEMIHKFAGLLASGNYELSCWL